MVDKLRYSLVVEVVAVQVRVRFSAATRANVFCSSNYRKRSPLQRVDDTN